MSTIEGEENIKSVNIRSIDIKKRLLMSSPMVEVFQSFLKDNVCSEVLVINTNVGMEVYYCSENNYSGFIKESFLLYTVKNISPLKLRFRNHLNREQVHKNFQEALFTFAGYPRLFLAYAKKFIHHVKENNSNSKQVVPILNGFFEEGLRLLAEKGNVPYYDKIQNVKNKPQKLGYNEVIKKLISEILNKKHSN